MDFKAFFEKCQSESTVSDFESYLSYSILEKGKGHAECTVEKYNRMRDLAFDRRDESAAMALFELANVAGWKDGEWEGALR
ncbi:MAG: hypothetical protein WAW37_10250 [Syntrophobacteraceae bacterium]